MSVEEYRTFLQSQHSKGVRVRFFGELDSRNKHLFLGKDSLNIKRRIQTGDWNDSTIGGR